MSLSTTESRKSYAGNGATTAFSFPYYFLANADLIVIIRVTATGIETTKTITTHYTVSGAGVQAGGTVTMLTAPAVGETITIYRDPAATQPLDLVENDESPAESIEQAFDRAAMGVQRVKDLISRSLRLPDGYATATTMTLSPSASKLIGWDAAGTGLANYASAGNLVVSSFIETLLDDTTAAAARTTLDVSQAINSLTAETAPAVADLLAFYDASAAADRKITFENFLKVINSLTADTAPATDDLFLTYDTSASGVKKVALADYVNGATAETTIATNDTLPVYDTSATALRKATVENIVAGGAASQAEMETASATNRAVTPGRVQYHPGVAKAWIIFDADDGSPDAAASYNMDAITDNGAGDFTINFTTDFSSGNYCGVFGARGDGGLAGYVVEQFDTPTRTAGTNRIYTLSAADAPTDFPIVSCCYFGDQ